MADVSPLHRVIDDGRWDAERLLGRLIMVVHAAFLDAGFVPHAHAVPTKSGRIPRRVGARASTLSLRYAAPHQQDEPVELRIGALGMHVVFYVFVPRFAGDTRPVMHWACVDARSAAPLLSGDLDDTARALANDDTLLASLWSVLTEKLSSRAFAGLCRENALASLPCDVLLAILARLGERKDIAMVASTSAELRRLVTDHKGEMLPQTFVDRFDEIREIVLSMRKPTKSSLYEQFNVSKFGRKEVW